MHYSLYVPLLAINELVPQVTSQQQLQYYHHLHSLNYESTAGADTSVEVPKLHNIKLLIASFYTHIDYYHDEHL